MKSRETSTQNVRVRAPQGGAAGEDMGEAVVRAKCTQCLSDSRCLCPALGVEGRVEIALCSSRLRQCRRWCCADTGEQCHQEKGRERDALVPDGTRHAPAMGMRETMLCSGAQSPHRSLIVSGRKISCLQCVSDITTAAAVDHTITTSGAAAAATGAGTPTKLRRACSLGAEKDAISDGVGAVRGNGVRQHVVRSHDVAGTRCDLARGMQ